MKRFPKSLHLLAIGTIALLSGSRSASARLYDRFDDASNWTLASGSGTASIGSSQLTLSVPASTITQASAQTISSQNLTGTRQSILVRSHTGSPAKTVFFYNALASTTGNSLEMKINDQASTTITCGYYVGGAYTFAGSTAFSLPPGGLYMAYRESGGTIYYETSSDAITWTTVATISAPFSTSALFFQAQHKAYGSGAPATSTVVDSFNYKNVGAGYDNIEDKTTSGGTNWQLYTEAFSGGTRQCSNDGCTTGTPPQIVVNGVASGDHFTDSTIPSPRLNTTGYRFQIVQTDALSNNWYTNAYRYQNLALVDADTWTYHMYFKYTYPQTITQGLEFPLNKYTGSNRLQAAVAWYPTRPDTGTHSGTWSVWTGSSWLSTGFTQTLTPGTWLEVTYTVGLHDNNVYYTNFKAGTPGSLTNYAWAHTYAAPADGTSAHIVPAVQIDDNISDTAPVSNTEKDLYMADWNIDWSDEKLP